MVKRWPGAPDGFQPKPDVHPAGESLMAYADGELELDARATVDTHLRTCTACRSKVHQFRHGSDVFQKVPPVPTQRVPMSLRRDLYKRIDEVDRRRRVIFGVPVNVSAPSANALALSASLVLLALIIPQFVGMWGVISGRGGDLSQQAAASEAPLAPTMVPLPTTTLPAVLPSVAPTQPPAAPTMEATSQPAGATTVAQTSRVQATATAPQPTAQPAAARSPVATAAAAAPTVQPPAPTATTAPAPVLRAIAGQVTNVNKPQHQITVQTGANAEGGSRPWVVQLAETTQVTYRDGKVLKPDDVGFADYVEVGGFQTGTAPLVASSVKITQSTVIQAQQKPRVLVLLDGAGSLRPPAFGFTGDWIQRLSETGYEVTAVDPSTIGATTNIKDFALVAIGYPATLSPAAITNVVGSRVPVLNAEPRLVQALGLGLNLNASNPIQNVPGKTVDVAGSAGPITRGFGAETTLAVDTLYRVPIVSNGTVLGTVTDGGQRRAVWSMSGNRIYFGFWYSMDGRNHTPAYWHLFDRSVLQLIGKDPLAASTPTPTPR